MVREEDFECINSTRDGMFTTGEKGVIKILLSHDHKVVLVCFEDGKCLLGICTKKEYIAYYPMNDLKICYPIKAVLMDLDGTTLYSEQFWISIIEKTVNAVMVGNKISFSEEDYPYVSGHSVSEHLEYCREKYNISVDVVDMMKEYYDIAREELQQLVEGKHCDFLIEPARYLVKFLSALKERNIKVGLVTSGLYEKGYPEIYEVCRKLNLGRPEDVYNSIITAGMPLGDHKVGTLGELAAKPHPWLYLESAIVGLGLELQDRNHIIGIEDSTAGVCALRSAGIPIIGVAGGNIISGGMKSLCIDVCDDLEEIYQKYICK